MTIPNEKEIEWSSDDARALRVFLTSEVGQRALSFVSDACPVLLDGGDVNKTLVRNGEVKGFSLAVNTLLELVTKQPEKLNESAPNYPSLDDESQWPDGKPNPETKS